MAERLHRQWQTDQQHMAEPFRGGSAPRPTSQTRWDQNEMPGTSSGGSAPPAQRQTGPAQPLRTETDQSKRLSDGGPVPRSREETTAARRAAAAAWFRGNGDSP